MCDLRFACLAAWHGAKHLGSSTSPWAGSSQAARGQELSVYLHSYYYKVNVRMKRVRKHTRTHPAQNLPHRSDGRKRLSAPKTGFKVCLSMTVTPKGRG